MSDRRTGARQEPSKSSDPWADTEVNFRYIRAQALADGVLIAVPAELAAEAGFRWPVALTAAAWADADEHNNSLQADLNGPARSYGYGVAKVLGSASGRTSRLSVG